MPSKSFYPLLGAALLLPLMGVAVAHDPQASPLAKVSQRVGSAELTVEYSSPAVKRRKIWGDLVPFDRPWRTGANASTKVTFTKDVIVGETPVPAGTYSLLTIPGAKSWKVILNKNSSIRGDMENYKKDEDVATVTVAPKAVPPRERLTFIFSDFTNDTVSLDLEWEKIRVSIPIKLKAS